MKKKLGIVLAVALAVAAVFLTMIFIVYGRENEYDTYTALMYDTDETVAVTGVFVRNEVLQPVGGSAVWYLAKDGEKVAKGQAIAGIYGSDGSVTAARRLELLQAELAQLQTSQSQSISDVGSSATADGFLTQVQKLSRQVYAAAATGNAAKAAECREKLTGALNRYCGCLGSVDYTEGIAELTAEISALKTQTGSYTSKKSGYSGYFYSYADNMTAVTPESVLSELDAQSVSDLTERAMLATNDSGAKIVTEYRWYYFFTLPSDTALLLPENNMTLRFPTVDELTVSVKLEKSVRESGTTTYCVSSVSRGAELGGRRIENAEVIISNVSGLRIPIKALKTQVGEDGTEQTGVYVAVGPIMEFRKVNVLLNEGDYAVCENVDKSGWLRLYDDVIVKGKNLYDGKSM